MLISAILFAIIGWFIGVHAPWWGVLLSLACIIAAVLNEEGLEGIFLIYGGGFLVVGMLLGGFIYGDLSNAWAAIDFKYLLTGGE
tara:strand:- start:2804 stop:3058 length:255 start_codon:yes stop_codon:yes gene_type:complete